MPQVKEEMIIIEEYVNLFCEIVRLGFDYYNELLESFPKDCRLQEQLNHLNSIQDSIYKYDASHNHGLIIRTTDIPYCKVLLKDASEFCDTGILEVVKELLIQIENDKE